jgi:hypothetical protein
MKRILMGSLFAAAVVFFAYGTGSAQIVEKVKDAADATKDATVGAAKKTKVVVTDGLEKAADKTGDVAKSGAKKTKNFGSNAVTTTENVTGEVRENGKYYSVKTWDGTKWVSKRVWHASKKGATATKEAVAGDDTSKP